MRKWRKMSVCLLAVMFSLFVRKCEGKIGVPALFLFGDSFLDAGNNNFLSTHAKANLYPYGIDFPFGTTGRFTNGLTMADFFAEWLGLRYIPPILPMDKTFSSDKTFEGFNYASGSAGIFNDTGSSAGENLCLSKQVSLFKQTVEQHLRPHFGSNLPLYLAKSIFMVYMGYNDYGFNFVFNKTLTNRPHTPMQFSDLIINNLGTYLTEIYRLGARKFVVFELPAMGCVPQVQRMLNATRCVDWVNKLANAFNVRLGHKLKQLTSTLQGSTFLLAKTFNLTYRMINNPTHYGITSAGVCCGPNMFVCKDRNQFEFFEGVHPTQAFYKVIASKCFNGTSFCDPMNLQQLVNKK